jgi:hypothetical protein
VIDWSLYRSITSILEVIGLIRLLFCWIHVSLNEYVALNRQHINNRAQKDNQNIIEYKIRLSRCLADVMRMICAADSP